LDNVL
jgi:hypothetical protein